MGMTAENLRKSILQYAMEGKLVSQDPEDVPASVLIDKIYTEKQRLQKEGIIKRDKNESVIYKENGRYYEKKNNEITDITEELPFDIPDSWAWNRIVNLVTVNPRNSLPDEQETSFVEMSAIKEGYSNSFTHVVRPWGKIKSGFTHFRDGDVGFAKITPCFQNRKSVVFKNLKNGYGAGTTELHILRAYENTILPDYLLWLVKSQYFIQSGISHLSGTAGQQRFGTDDLKMILVPVPPVAEQRRIVEKIDEYELLLGEYECLEDELSVLDANIHGKLRRSILQYAIEGKLIPQYSEDGQANELVSRINEVREKALRRRCTQGYIRMEDDGHYYEYTGDSKIDITDKLPFDIPNSWTWIRFQNLVDFRLGKTPDRHVDAYWEKGIYPWFSISDLKEGCVVTSTKEQVTQTALNKCFSGELTPKDTLVMSFKLTIGKVSILGVDAVHNEAIISIYPYLTEENTVRDYLSKILGIMVTYVEETTAIKGSTLNSKKLGSMLIPLPPIEEQKRIVNEIEKYESLLDGLGELV